MSEHEGIWTEYRPTYWDGWSAVKRMGDLVRCRDCGLSTNGGMQCKRHKDSGWSGNTWVEEYEQVDPDGFCAWGERRDA